MLDADVKKKRICVLGSTGSIGVSTLDVIARHPTRYQVFALTAHSQVNKLAEQCEQFKPEVAVVGSASAAAQLQILLREKKLKTEVAFGADALCEVARSMRCDTVMAAIVGAAEENRHAGDARFAWIANAIVVRIDINEARQAGRA